MHWSRRITRCLQQQLNKLDRFLAPRGRLGVTALADAASGRVAKQLLELIDEEKQRSAASVAEEVDDLTKAVARLAQGVRKALALPRGGGGVVNVRSERR